MFQVATIKTGFAGLIGWRQNIDSSGVQITTGSTLLDSSSGLYFNEQHPLLSFANLVSIAPDVKTLHPGNSTNQNTEFTTWLQRKTEDAIIEGLNYWFNTKMQRKTAKNLLQYSYLYRTAQRAQDVDTNNGKTVGIALTPRRGRSVSTRIRSISIQLTANQDITVMLFESGKSTPVQSQAITYTGNGAAQWVNVDWTLESGPTYYLVYDQDDLTGQSVNGAIDQARTMYGNSRDVGVTILPQQRYVTATAFSANVTPTALWDIQDNTYTTDTNFGLNVDMDVRCDYTDFIIGQKDLFATYLAKFVAIKFLYELIHNPQSRVNRNANNVNIDRLIFEIEGDPQGRATGVRKEMLDALNSITFDIEGIEKECLPCKKYGVKYGAI